MLAAEADAYSKAEYGPTHQNSKRRYRKQRNVDVVDKSKMPSMNDATACTSSLSRAGPRPFQMADSNIAKRNNPTYPSRNSTSTNVECEAMLVRYKLNAKSSTGATRGS